MPDDIFLIQGETLVEMNEQGYDSEALLQELLADYPKLLAGGQIDSSSPRRWLLIRREMGLPSKEDGGNRWSVDHLFLDQDAVPTLVEVKRSSNTEIRRKVVGQMLDYAANAVMYWPVEQIRAEFEAGADDPQETLAEFLDEDADLEEFWKNVKTNLQAGKIRMLFVADKIPNELRRIVEFLNGQMDPAEVLAVEIKQFVGTGMKTLVPRVMGQTADAETKKSTGTTSVTNEVRLAFWTAFCEMAAKHDPEVAPGLPSDGARMDFVSDDPDFAVKCWVDPNCTKFSVVLWLQGGDAEEQCKQLKQYLEKAGGDLKMPWECGHGKKGKGFVVKTTWKLNLDDKETSAKQHKRIVDAVQEIRDVLIPRLRKSDD